MENRQKELIKDAREALAAVLKGTSPLGVYFPAYENYTSAIARLVKEYKNQETVAVGFEFLDSIYQAKLDKQLIWINRVEEATALVFSFTDLSEVNK